MNDLGFAFRRLRQSPGFTAVAILTLALGIGANTAIFSVVNTVLLRTLDYPRAEQLVNLWSKSLRSGVTYAVSAPDFHDWQAQSQSFEALAHFSNGPSAILLNHEAESADAADVSENFFRVLAVPPSLGRPFSAEEWKTSGVAIISERLARRHFSGGPERALGATLKLDGKPLVIVGVMPAGFLYPDASDIWIPANTRYPETTSRSAHNYLVVGRLRTGVPQASANAELEAIGARLTQAYPESNTNKGVAVRALDDHLVRDHRGTLWLLLGAAATVLLIACANVANLLLARGVARRREFAVRAALGASSGRLIAHQLAESAIVAAAAAGLGLLIATYGVQALIALAPPGVPRLNQVSVDWPTLFFTAAVSVAVCFATGLIPAREASRVDLVTGLKSGGAGAAGGSGKLRGMLVVGQLALSLALLSSAGLLVASLLRLNKMDPGFRTERVLVMDADFPAADQASAPDATAFFENLGREAAAQPGVVSVAFAREMPLGRPGSNGTYFIEGRLDAAPGASNQDALWRFVSRDYFATLGIPLRRGRTFAEGLDATKPQEVVINETMARSTWPNDDPIGRRIRIGMSTKPQWMTIVGVVADVKQVSLKRAISQELYVAAAQFPLANTQTKLIAQTSAAPETLFEPFRKLARSLNAEVPVKFTTAQVIVAETLAAPRFRALLITLFSVVAFVIALVGVAGVMACIVAGRRAETGIRLALGAQPWQVVSLMLREGLRFVALGLALGLLAAAGAARLLAAHLFGVGAFDPSIVSIVCAVFTLVALVACLIPSLRATRVDPIASLRSE